MFLSVLDNGIPKKMRKQKLCWLLQNEAVKISSDLSRRFIGKNTLAVQPRRSEIANILWVNDILTRGDQVIVEKQDQIYLGMILDFKKCDERSKKSRSHVNDLMNLTKSTNLYFILNPLFKIDLNSMAVQTLKNICYFHQNMYVCHLNNNFSDFTCPIFMIQLRNLIAEHKNKLN